MNGTSRQKINNKTVSLHNTIDQMDPRDINQTFYPTAAEYTIFSSMHRTFCRIDGTLGHRTNFNKFKIVIIPNIFYDHNRMKLVIHSRETRK